MGVRVKPAWSRGRFEEGSMFKSKLRLLGVSALVGAGLMAAGPVGAANVTLGGVDIQIDTTLSSGVSFRVEDRNTKFLPSVNGGPSDTRQLYDLEDYITYVATPGNVVDANNLTDAEQAAAMAAGGIATNGTVSNPAGGCLDHLSVCVPLPNTRESANYDGSINGDDGRLNFDNGDLTSGSIKFVSEFNGYVNNDISFFARVRGFYDAVLADDSSYERSTPFGDKVEDEHHFNIELLDAFISYNTDIGGMPAMIRAGKQVINWGESTFFLGGNSVFNPIDVPALRKPGAEIKEALLPVEAIYASISLPYDISVEAYVGGWDRFKIDNGGTPFGSSDAAFPGSSANRGGSLIGGGNYGGAAKFNYDYAGMGALTAAIGGVVETYLDSEGITEASHPASSFDFNQTALTNTTPEEARIAYNDPYYIARLADDEPDDFGDTAGLAVRWYAEALNSTEFALYAQQYTSRIPRFGIRALGPELGFTTAGGITTDTTNRGVAAQGCGATLAGAAVIPGVAFTFATHTFNNIPYVANDENDPTGLHRDAGVDAILTGGLGAHTSTAGTLARVMEMNCKSVLATDSFDSNGAAAGGGVYRTGAMILAAGFPMGLYAEYPEDREVYGISAATTILGWGVQGEIAYRPNNDFQIDTDTLVIGAIVANCGFDLNYGGNLSPVFNSYATYAVASGIGCTGQAQDLQGWDEGELYNFDIGTTALYSASNPVVSAIGANSIVLLTELAAAYIPDLETRTINTSDGPVTVESTENGYLLGNYCTSGGDVPLSGLFGLDPRNETECRMTQFSSTGLLLLGAQYNNVFGSAWNLNPTLIHRQGLDGRGLGGVQGVGSSSLSLNASYQETTIGISYTDYFGDEKRTKAGDQDTVSINISHAF